MTVIDCYLVGVKEAKVAPGSAAETEKTNRVCWFYFWCSHYDILFCEGTALILLMDNGW